MINDDIRYKISEGTPVEDILESLLEPEEGASQERVDPLHPPKAPWNDLNNDLHGDADRADLPKHHND